MLSGDVILDFVHRIRGVLEGIGVEVTQRYKRGQDIDAACGQLEAKSRIPLATLATTPGSPRRAET